MRDIRLVIHNIRSAHNVGALLRTADGLGLKHVYITGYSPYPTTLKDSRLPHIAEKNTRAIHKTALGAEQSQAWSRKEDLLEVLSDLRSKDFAIIGLEQDPTSVLLPKYEPSNKLALLLGEEVSGLPLELRRQCHTLIEIPMFGKKESFNVVEAASMAMYHLRFLGLSK